MKLKVLTIGLLSVLSLAACDKSSDNIADELDERATEAATRGEWKSPCLSMSLPWEVAGLSSQVETYNLWADASKTVKLFGEDNCTDAKIEVVYSGDTSVGSENAQGNNTVDFNFNKVTAKVLDQATVDTLNSAVVPSCGFNDWALNVEKDITAQAGDINCPVAKATPVYDIIKAGGSFIRFGKKEGDLDKSTPEKRPAVIDDTIEYKR